MSKKLILREGQGLKTEYPLKDLMVIGSDDTCDIQIRTVEATDRHARIERKDDGICIKDLRTATGTFINGSRIIEAYLNSGDEITINGFSIRFLEIEDHVLSHPGLRSKNESWNNELRTLVNVAKTEHPVIILGPSGTGKELIAQAIHEQSDRRLGAFVSVNCSALTETLIESELFGHMRGSFTGAVADRKGAFEAARGGTLFLDEIGDLPYGLQAKLLRALENKEIRPVGSDRTIKTDVRIVSATHQSLNDKFKSNEFRADLYFRLNVININPPALKERMEDFSEILGTFARQMKVRFSFSAIQEMKKHSWPGNIRELKNTVARASAMYPAETIEPQHLSKLIDDLSPKGSIAPFSLGLPIPTIPYNSTERSVTQPNTASSEQLPVMKEIERNMIIQRLTINHGNQRRTAAELGIPKSTLHDRLKIYNIDPRSYQRRSI
jgi:DNA-binding NtrC family response regulator